MTASAVLNDFRVQQFQNEQDLIIVSNIASSLKRNYTIKEDLSSVDVSSDLNKILAQTSISIKKFANSNFKLTASLDLNEIEHIKTSLKNFVSNNDRVVNFKNEIIEDLSNLQKKVKRNYVENISELNKKKVLCEKMIRIYENEKNRIIMERLSRIVWPYDEKTKVLDNKIASLQIQAQQYGQKAVAAGQMRPAATEKDILLCELKLKEKYSKLVK